MAIKFRGFKLCHKLSKLVKWTTHRREMNAIETVCLNPKKPGPKIFTWAKRLNLFTKSRPGYIRVGHDPDENERPQSVPKGHLAINVGEKESDTKRFFVPVIYFNDPLFGDLLKWAEEEYGFVQSGRIQIPCRVSEFERVKKMIHAAGGRIRRRRQLLRLRFSL